ncbi:tetratricopeptide repeat protein [Vibrio hepatarius]|uniref:tetratricopeptide repeat protein n=1 Tax=Vibrio hepatarius TaxID=171383 RepID=UPI001C08919E|nr:tetratricopeptide repeat protein [Vibrio hepatarius]MBU2896706.1 sel1 repeat family protein [Vibrio hepatarius]
MNLIGIAIGATGLLLLGSFIWMLVLQMRKKRLEEQRIERSIAKRKALENNRQQEEKDRVKKAEGGDITTILFLAKEAERMNQKDAVYWYTKAAQLDNVNGMCGIVRLSEKFNDAVLNEQAKFWQVCIKALEGSLPDKYEMAIALFNGLGTDQDVEKALKVMMQAADHNFVNAQLFLGEWFVSPKNTNPKPNLSTEYYQKAAAMRSNEGRLKLGLNYIHGVGVSANSLKGCYWMERAAEKGYTEAMYKVAEEWMKKPPDGESVAYIWLFIAAQLGHNQSAGLRDQIALNIGVDTVVGLQSLAKPILKKISENKVGKHSVIKALNKLYKRGILLEEQDILQHQETESETLQETDPTAAASDEIESTATPVEQKPDIAQ